MSGGVMDQWLDGWMEWRREEWVVRCRWIETSRERGERRERRETARACRGFVVVVVDVVVVAVREE